jgi:hypothetical protein
MQGKSFVCVGLFAILPFDAPFSCANNKEMSRKVNMTDHTRISDLTFEALSLSNLSPEF